MSFYTRPIFGGLYFSYDSNVEAITVGLHLDQMYKTSDGTLKVVYPIGNVFVGGSTVLNSQSVF